MISNVESLTLENTPTNEWFREFGNLDLDPIDLGRLLEKADGYFSNLVKIKHSMDGSFSNIYSAMVSSFADLVDASCNNEPSEEKVVALKNSMNDIEKTKILHDAMLQSILLNVSENGGYHSDDEGKEERSSISEEYRLADDAGRQELFVQYKLQGDTEESVLEAKLLNIVRSNEARLLAAKGERELFVQYKLQGDTEESVLEAKLLNIVRSNEARLLAAKGERLFRVLEAFDILENLLKGEIVENGLRQLINIPIEDFGDFKKYVESISTDEESYVFNLIKATPQVKSDRQRNTAITKAKELFGVWYNIVDILASIVQGINDDQTSITALERELLLRLYKKLEEACGDDKKASMPELKSLVRELSGKVKALILDNPGFVVPVFLEANPEVVKTLIVSDAEFTQSLLMANCEVVNALISSDPEFHLNVIMTFASRVTTITSDNDRLKGQVSAITSDNDRLKGQVSALTSVKDHIVKQCSSVRVAAIGVAVFAAVTCAPLIVALVMRTTVAVTVCAAVALAFILVLSAVTVYMAKTLNPDNISSIGPDDPDNISSIGSDDLYSIFSIGSDDLYSIFSIGPDHMLEGRVC